MNFYAALGPEICSSPLGQTRPTTLYINKDRVVKAFELQAVLRGRKETMQQRRAPALALFKMYFCVKGVSPLLRAIITFSKLP